MIHKTRSIKSVIDKVSRDLNLQIQDRWVSVIEWSAEALEQIGVGPNYQKKEKLINIKDYKGLLPCDFIRTIGISKYIDNTPESQRTPMTYNSAHSTNDRGLVYTINGSWINTGFREGLVVLFYEGLEVDEEGFPMMPDNISYLEACFWYCAMKLLLGGHENKNIKYETAEARWHHYCSQARGKFYMPDNDKIEAIKMQWVRMIPVINAHSTEFSVFNRYERSKI